jgi:hypothetical protein
VPARDTRRMCKRFDVWSRRRWKYVELEPPTPLTGSGQVRLPGIDMTMITGREAKVTDDIEAQVLELAADLAPEPLPYRAEEYGDQLCAAFGVEEGTPARDWVWRWLAFGWIVGTVEESNGAARPGEVERHHLAVLNLLRRRMYDELEENEDESVRACADAYFLALFGGYYLRREPTATTDNIMHD